MTRSTSPHGRTGRPPVTSRAQILTAARRIIDRDGWEKLTVRRVAAELGIGATTLYHHVRDREDLLVQLVNEHLDQAPRPVLPSTPRDRIIVTAQMIHDTLAAWPGAAEILTTDGFLARLDQSSLEMVEVVIAAAVEQGCSLEQAVEVFRSIWYYTVGEILVRSHSASRRSIEPVARQNFLTDLDASRVPRLAEVGNRWLDIEARDNYAEALEAFVDGLLSRATRA